MCVFELLGFDKKNMFHRFKLIFSRCWRFRYVALNRLILQYFMQNNLEMNYFRGINGV